MKTNVVMKREIGNLPVYQRTKDGYFNATELLRCWNSMVDLNRAKVPDLENRLKSGDRQVVLKELQNEFNLPFNKKELKDYLSFVSTKEFVSILSSKEGISLDKVYMASRGKNGGTWMHPLLFVDFAMWLNPEFKYDVLSFVRDKMIEYRDKAGDAYKKLSNEILKITNKDFMSLVMTRVSIALNYVVFGQHYKDVRNDFGTEDRMNELYDLEIKVASLLEDGFLNSIQDIINYLRRKYKQKYFK